MGKLVLFILVFGVAGLSLLAYLKLVPNEPEPNKSEPSAVTPSPRPTTTEVLGLLPAIYYFLALFCGVVLIGFTIANVDELNSTQIGAWIGYTVGAVLSMLAVGRVIELLQQIRDAVRS